MSETKISLILKNILHLSEQMQSLLEADVHNFSSHSVNQLMENNARKKKINEALSATLHELQELSMDAGQENIHFLLLQLQETDGLLHGSLLNRLKAVSNQCERQIQINNLVIQNSLHNIQKLWCNLAAKNNQPQLYDECGKMTK
jgi:hypothetical protein